MLPHCTYISTHPSGWFYAGKGNKIRAAYSDAQQRPEVKLAKSIAIKAAIAGEEHRIHMAKASREAAGRPEVKLARSNMSKQMWALPKMREKILASRINKRSWVPVSLNGATYRSMASALRATGMSKNQLLRHLSFKELT